MKNLSIKVIGIMIVISVSLMASGPRVTGTLFTSIQNEIVAVETPPLYSTTSLNGGMVFEIVTAALKIEKESATFTTYPVHRMVKYYVTQEKVLAALGINFNLSKDEKRKVISIPVAIIDEQYMYYKPVHPKGISWNGKLSELKGLKYGAHKGEDTSAYKKAEIKVLYGESRFLFKKLKTQKVDFIKEPVLSAKAMIDTNFAADKNQFGIMESTPQKSVCMIHFNLQNPQAREIAKKFTKGLSSILKSGQYQTIVEKYVGKTATSVKNIDELKTLLVKSL